jgi:hypothetical protein
MDLSKKTIDELKQIAKANNLTGYSTLRKPALVRYLESFGPILVCEKRKPAPVCERKPTTVCERKPTAVCERLRRTAPVCERKPTPVCERKTAPVCENLQRSEVLQLAKEAGVNPQKTISQLCAEINAKTHNLLHQTRWTSPSPKKSNPLREKLRDLLYSMTPLSDDAIKEVMECARYVVAIIQGKIDSCYFDPDIPAQQIYKDLIRILESGVIADLYVDYISDPGPMPRNLEKILVGEAILSTFARYTEMLVCLDEEGIDYIYSREMVDLLKNPEDD